MDQILTAEQKWRELADVYDHHDTLANYQAMERAYEAYHDLCNEIDQCLTIGCRNIDHQYAYCSDHRE